MARKPTSRIQTSPWGRPAHFRAKAAPPVCDLDAAALEELRQQAWERGDLPAPEKPEDPEIAAFLQAVAGPPRP